jgi:lipoate-protein ligase A
VTLFEHSDTALVIGSTQDMADIDTAVTKSKGISVVRRRSGGGAVFLRPGESVWIDVVIPRGDSLWTDDVSASSLWLGDVWSATLRQFGVEHTVVHRDAMVKTSMSRTICFDGLAPGEVTSATRKVVGISQRRTRDGARFQCVVYSRWDPTSWRDCLATADAQRALDELSVACIAASGEELLAAIASRLPTLPT